MLLLKFTYILAILRINVVSGSISVSTRACHARKRGSTPRQRVLFERAHCVMHVIFVQCYFRDAGSSEWFTGFVQLRAERVACSSFSLPFHDMGLNPEFFSASTPAPGVLHVQLSRYGFLVLRMFALYWRAIISGNPWTRSINSKVSAKGWHCAD